MHPKAFKTLHLRVKSLVDSTVFVSQPSNSVFYRKNTDTGNHVNFTLVCNRLTIEEHTAELVEVGMSVHSLMSAEQTAKLRDLITRP